MADELREEFGIESKLIPGAGGIFEVIADGQIIYEKAKTGTFPEKGELLDKLRG